MGMDTENNKLKGTDEEEAVAVSAGDSDNAENVKKSGGRKVGMLIVCALIGVLTVVAMALRMISEWYESNYKIPFKELLYTLLSPLEGTGEEMIKEILGEILPAAIIALAIYVAVAIITKARRSFRLLSFLLSVALLANSGMYAWNAFGIGDYIRGKNNRTTIYEDLYVDPNSVAITAEGKTKNLIYIYLESMETTYASVADGGYQESINYIPNLTALAKENVSFSNKANGLLGGFSAVDGTGVTTASLFATSAGIPFSFPMRDVNTMSTHVNFASGVTTLGDILQEKGYRQMFLCGSDAVFGGRKTMYTQHGGYEIYDLYTARENGDIPPDYLVWWGYEDMYLFEIAKRQLTELASGDQPFNFTMLTVDPHAVGGYTCSLCGNEYEDKLGNILSCGDKQLNAFIEWCKTQDFYEDTTIVIVGDHPRHDSYLVEGAEMADRTSYNCIINPACLPQGETENRVFTAMDMFPTVLAAMGFTVEGDMLGLGVNMFSGKPTLAESMTYAKFKAELSKYSEYYVLQFS